MARRKCYVMWSEDGIWHSTHCPCDVHVPVAVFVLVCTSALPRTNVLLNACLAFCFFKALELSVVAFFVIPKIPL
jgi:hypothetical protein